MGFLKKLFGGDPRKDLEKARAFLAQGRPDRALDLARDVAASSDAEVAGAGRELVTQARRALIDNALGMAKEAEASEFWEDALEWLDRAVEQIEDTEEQARILAWRERLEAALEASEAEEWEEPKPQASPEDLLDADDLDVDGHFTALVDMMEDEIGRLYAAQGDDFRNAYLDLYDGRPEQALPVLSSLVERNPQDPVLRFERGRALLFTGDPASARTDLEFAWQAWGDVYLDRAGTLTVASEWGEALLALSEPGPILDKLEGPAHPGTGQPELTSVYARALLQAERYDEAEPFLLKAMEHFPSRPELGMMAAGLLMHQERYGDAVQCLEMVIAPSCASGSCGAPRKFPPAFRALAGLYLKEPEGEETDKQRQARLQRVDELLTQLRGALGGGMAREDMLLQAELYSRRGQEAEAVLWREKAEQVASSADQLDVVKSEAPKMAADTPI